MEQRNTIRTVKFVQDDEFESTGQEIRITTDTRMAEKRSAQIELELHDVPYSCNDARFLIEKKKRRRCAAEIQTGIENMTPEAQLDEERKARSSPIIPLRSEAKRLISVKRDTNLAAPFHRCNHCGSPDHFSPECHILSEDLICSFCNKMGHVDSVCFQAHPERVRNPKRTKHQAQTCNHCGSQDHVTPECNILAEDLHCYFCDKMGHLEEVCFQAHPERGRNLKRAKHQQQIEYAPFDTCNRCGLSDHVSRECNVPTKDLHCSFCNRPGHVESVCFQVQPERVKNQQHIEYTAQQRDAAVVSVQGKEKERECMRKKNIEGDKKESEFAAIIASMRADNRKLKAERDELKRETDTKISSLASANGRLSSELNKLKREIDDQTLFNTKLRNQLDDARGEMQDAQTKFDAVSISFSLLVEKNKELEVKKQEAESAVRDERRRAELRFAEIRELKSLDDEMKKRQSLAIVKSIQADKQKLAAELAEQKQKADARIETLTSEKTSLRNDLDAARIAIQAVKTEYDKKLAIVLSGKENVEKKLALVMGETNATLVVLNEQKAQVTTLETELARALTKIENLEKELDCVEARGATRVELDRQTALVTEEPDDARGAMQDAQTSLDKATFPFSLLVEKNKELEMKKQEAESAVREEKMRSELRLAEIRERKSLEEEMNKKRSLAVVKSIQADKQKLAAELAEQKQKAGVLIQSLTSEKTSLRNELDTARIAIQDGKTDCDKKLAIVLSEKENVEKKLALVMTETNALQFALTEQKAQVTKLETELAAVLTKKENLGKELDCVEARGATRIELDRQTASLTEEHDDKLRRHKTLSNLMCQKRKLENDVSLMQKEAAEDKRNLVQARNDLDTCRAHVAHLETVLNRLREGGNELTKLEYDSILLRENKAQDERKLVRAHKNELDEAITDVVNLERALQSLAEERNRRGKLEYEVILICEEAAEEKRKLVRAHNELVKARTDIADLERELESLREERHLKNPEYDVNLIREEQAEVKRNLVQAHKNEMDMAKTHIFHLEKEVKSLMGLQYDVNLIQEEAEAYKRELTLAHHDLDDAKAGLVHLQREIISLREERNRLEKLECDVDLLREEAAEEKRKLVEAYRNELDEASTDKAHLKTELQSLGNKKNRLESAHEAMKRKLDEEKERNLCQICMELPKDTISFPCLHLHYCFSCLDKHRKQNNSCPSCRTPINGVLKSDILT